MPKFVEPTAFLIAETTLDPLGLQKALDELGVSEWRTDAVSDAEHLIEFAGKSCYMSFDTSLNKNLTRVGTRNNYAYIQEQIMATGHGSVLEHATVTFFLLNVSRVFTHELVRHRAGTAFSQVSGRYVRTDVINYWLPSVIRKDEWASNFFHSAFATMELWVRQLEAHYKIDELKGGAGFFLKKVLTSAFRRIIGNGQSNHIVLTSNHRALRHMIELRTDFHAEEEIRIVFNQMFNLVKDRFPALYGDATVTYDEENPELFSVKFTGKKV
jgi:thymidylate synthase (FAD)